MWRVRMVVQRPLRAIFASEARVSLYLSVIATLIAGTGLGYNLWLDRQAIVTHAPSAFAVFRGFHPFPSDHLALPLDFENRGGRSVVMRHFRLVLEDSSSSSSPVTFVLAGELDGLRSRGAGSPGPYRLTRSVTLPGRSVSHNVLLFHIEGWFEVENEQYRQFRFSTDSCYRASLYFQVNEATEDTLQVSFLLPMFGDIENLGDDGDRQWEFYSLWGVNC